MLSCVVVSCSLCVCWRVLLFWCLMFVVCSRCGRLVCVHRCLLRVVCNWLFVYYLLVVVCYLMCVVCGSLCLAVRCVLLGACCVLLVDCSLLIVACGALLLRYALLFAGHCCCRLVLHVCRSLLCAVGRCSLRLCVVRCVLLVD